MNKLTSEETKNLSIEKAWEVAGDYATYLENGGGKIYSFTSDLPWDRDDILISLLKLLREYPTNKELMGTICNNIVILVSFHIQSEAEYQTLISIKHQIDARTQQ